MAEANKQGCQDAQEPSSDSKECHLLCSKSVPVVSLVKCVRCEEMICTNCMTLGPANDLPNCCPYCVLAIIMSRRLVRSSYESY